ncbi:MAG: D-alanine--D-alanine ligase [Abditibacteriaceae bacterium]
MTEKIRVAVLLGGDSSEREISFRSGVAMAQALPRDRYNVTMLDVASPSTRAQGDSVQKVAEGIRPLHACLPVEWNQLTTTLYTSAFDVALPAMHGGWGEDGTLQALLSVVDVPFVGSGQHASSIAIDKQVCKAFVATQGIQTPQSQLIADLDHIEDAATQWHKPIVIKPNRGGSSVAITILNDPAKSTFEEEFKSAVAAALNDGSAALVEEKIDGIEITAAVLGEGDNAEALPLIEIVPHSSGSFYDYEAKYSLGKSSHVIPPRISEEVQERIKVAAKKVHTSLGCRGVSRSDFIVTESGEIYFLEINTVPGMTATSLVPDSAFAAGIEFPDLVERLVKSAL